jgi:predicted acyl esterase
MFGESFGGQTSYSAALERPTHLLAIAPMQSSSSLFFDVIYPGGIKTTERGDTDNWPDIANLASDGVIDADAEFATNRAHATFDEFWHERAFVDVLDAITIPVLAIGGWTDLYFGAGALANIEALPDRAWAVYGPWNHYFPVAITEDTVVIAEHEHAPDMSETPQLRPGILLAWFDHWVGKVDGVPIPASPTFTSFEGPPGVGAGWVEFDRWDPSGDGFAFQLSAEDPTTLRQAGDERDAVTFTAEPLARDEVLVGHPCLTFAASLDADDAHFYVEVLDVAPDGTETLVNDGYLKASHRESHSHPTPVPIGTVIEYHVPIRAQHHRFVAGHRVRVRLGGGAPTKLTSPQAPVTITLEAAGSMTVCLPGFTRSRC